jgi:hypothetical protein
MQSDVQSRIDAARYKVALSPANNRGCLLLIAANKIKICATVNSSQLTSLRHNTGHTPDRVNATSDPRMIARAQMKKRRNNKTTMQAADTAIRAEGQEVTLPKLPSGRLDVITEHLTGRPVTQISRSLGHTDAS